jgi:hypothetical protein
MELEVGEGIGAFIPSKRVKHPYVCIIRLFQGLANSEHVRIMGLMSAGLG